MKWSEVKPKKWWFAAMQSQAAFSLGTLFCERLERRSLPALCFELQHDGELERGQVRREVLGRITAGRISVASCSDLCGGWFFFIHPSSYSKIFTKCRRKTLHCNLCTPWAHSPVITIDGCTINCMTRVDLIWSKRMTKIISLTIWSFIQSFFQLFNSINVY